MMAWDNGGIEPVYLCDSHADELGDAVKNYELSMATTARLLGKKQPGDRNRPTDGNGRAPTREVAAPNPQSLPRPGAAPEHKPAATQNETPSAAQAHPQIVAQPASPLTETPAPVVVAQNVTPVAQADPTPSITIPAGGSTNGDSAKASANDAIANTAHAESQAYRPALKGTPDAAEAKPSESAEPGRMCRSHNGERCTCEATVHCPTCGAWFCDAHAEDDQWHPCLLTM
jgi:hypothetical protein